ncbi:MAG: hypothetical protein VCA55_05170 [Verrucomicrobiales bacterium]
MFEFLLVIGTLFLALACRSFSLPLIRKCGVLTIIVATFLAGYFLGNNNIIWGFIAISSWFFLPWLDLLTRIRALRLPLDKKMRHRYPPPDTSRLLKQFTSDVEEAGFEYVQDSGWEWDGAEQFIRFFYDPELKAQATINLNQQSRIAFAYMSVSSRTSDGKTWTTWNYPFSYSMKITPDIEIKRAPASQSFAEMLNSHRAFLAHRGIAKDHLQKDHPDDLKQIAEREMRNQIDHNLDRGLIRLSGNGTFRYSWRGLLFLWLQSIKDMVRLS